MYGISDQKDKAKMGAKQILGFLIVVCFHFYHPASLFPQGNNSTSDNMGGREMNEQRSSIQGDGSGIASRRNFASGVASAISGGGGARGVVGGRPSGGAEEGNGGGGSTTPSTGAGGAAVIPLYAAGAANGHHNSHHGAASCNRSCVGLPTLCAVIFTSLLVHIYVVLGS